MLVAWDEPKRETNIRRHGLDFEDVCDRFAFERAVIFPTYAGRGERPRFVAVGPLDDRLVAVVFSPPRHGSDLGDQLAAGEPQGEEAL